jgi:hypothetical protein
VTPAAAAAAGWNLLLLLLLLLLASHLVAELVWASPAAGGQEGACHPTDVEARDEA